MTRLGILCAAGAALAVTPAQARERALQPYIEVSQVLTADLNNDDVLTYTSVAAGVDASIQSRRVEVQASYRYEHRFGWNGEGDDDVHSGLVRGAVRLTPALQIEAGALATRARADIRGDAPGVLAGGLSNVSNVYSAYAGPTVATRIGDATLNAAYRFGYTKVEAPDSTGVPIGQPRLDYFDESMNHMAMASVGVAAGEVLPIGLTASAAWEREDVSQLDQRYDGIYGRVDAVLPVSPTVAIVGGVGYEDIEISQRDALVDPTGAPVIDGSGRFVTAPGSPRRLAYQTDGLFWDAGVMWRPSRRTTLQARVGRRYDSMTYTGSLSYQINDGSGVQVGIYDSVDSIGRGLSGALADLPTSFTTRPDPFGDQFGGCVFGGRGSDAGGCLNPILGALTTAQFRSRGIDGVYSTNIGASRMGVGAGYANRKFLTPGAAPGFDLSGTVDEIYYAQAFFGRSLSPRSDIDLNAFVNYFDSGIGGASDVLGGGATSTYSYSFGRLGASASLGLFAFDQDPGEDDLSAQALVGMRYSF